MKIIEIEALANGAHRNQDGAFETVPSGWAAIPDDMPIPETFPFVDIETADVEHTRESEIPGGEPETYTVPTVTVMTAGTVPAPEPVPEAPPTNEELEAENKLLREQVAALSDQNDFQEELIVELANIVYA